jgi:hypothetical protein
MWERICTCWQNRVLCHLGKLQQQTYSRSKVGRCYALPPFRVPLMDYPGDPMLKNVDDEYMVGDRMLVAPMCR